MRMTSAILLAMALCLSACGGETTREKTVVVNPSASTPPGTVVVPPSDRVTKVCPAGYSNC